MLQAQEGINNISLATIRGVAIFVGRGLQRADQQHFCPKLPAGTPGQLSPTMVQIEQSLAIDKNKLQMQSIWRRKSNTFAKAQPTATFEVISESFPANGRATMDDVLPKGPESAVST